MINRFPINYRLKATPHRTHPVQIIVSLGCKDENGKYMTVVASTGITLKNNEWNNNKKRPFNADLHKKLSDLEVYLDNHFAQLSLLKPVAIQQWHKDGYFNEMIKEAVDKIIHEKPTQYEFFMDEVSKSSLTNAGSVIYHIKTRLLKNNYRIYDAETNEIDIEKFFSPILYNDDKKDVKTESLNLNSIDDLKPILFYKYIEHVAEQKLKDQIIDKKTKSDYINKLGKKFEEFNDKITLHQMSDRVSQDFFNYIRDEYDYGFKYFMNFKKWMKAVFNYAKIEEHISLPKIFTESSTYEKQTEKVIYPYLTEEMLDSISKLKFKENESLLEYVRDLCLIYSYTGGVRFSDWRKTFTVQHRNVAGQKVYYISIQSDKNANYSEIPLLDNVYEIINKKYHFKFKKISNKDYNSNIGEVVKRAGYTHDFVQYRRSPKSKDSQKIVTPFNELIKSHTNRRSFATNFYYHRNINPDVVRQYTGHKKLESFMIYVNATARMKFDDFAKQVVIEERKNDNNKK